MRVAIDAARPTSRERPARLFLMASMRDGDQGGLAAPAPPAAALVAAVQVLPPWLWLVVEPGRAMLPAGPWPDLAAAWQLAGNCNVGLRGVTRRPGRRVVRQRAQRWPVPNARRVRKCVHAARRWY